MELGQLPLPAGQMEQYYQPTQPPPSCNSITSPASHLLGETMPPDGTVTSPAIYQPSEQAENESVTRWTATYGLGPKGPLDNWAP